MDGSFTRWCQHSPEQGGGIFLPQRKGKTPSKSGKSIPEH